MEALPDGLGLLGMGFCTTSGWTLRRIKRCLGAWLECAVCATLRGGIYFPCRNGRDEAAR